MSVEEAKARRLANRLRHAEQRQAAQAARGPKGIVYAWYERARSVAADASERAAVAGQDPDEPWNYLGRTLENFCQHYEQ
jgi:hypothetical protein